MKLTKKKALEICVELWGWMAETGESRKGCWPGWEKYGYMKNGCPCCEFCNCHCENCPMKDSWPEKGCMAAGSIYIDWGAAREEANKEYAKIIANAAREELKKLK